MNTGEQTNLVCDVFLVEMIQVDLFLAMPSSEKLQKVFQKLVAKLVDEFLGVLADDEHLPHVALGLGVHFESIGVSALLLADLAEPSQAL